MTEVAKLNFTHGRGEQALYGCIVTSGRRYCKEAFISILLSFGVESVFIMPDHLPQVHPFVAGSRLNPRRTDLEEASNSVAVDAGGGNS